MNDCEVLVTGTFNLCHAGHCELLEFASKFGSVTVGINSDRYLQQKYGDKAVPLVQRAYVLSCNKFVDRVVVFLEDEPSRLIYKLRPRYYVRGPDYANKELVEMDAVHDVGAKLLIHQANKIQDSSSLVELVPENILDSGMLSDSIVNLQYPVEPLANLFPILSRDSEI